MAFRLGIAKFIIPFAFAYYPCLLIIEDFSWLEFISIVPRLLISIWFINSELAKFDFTKVIKKINFPFLVMTGDHDPNLYSSKEMVEDSEIGQIKILEGVGHGSVLQRPDLTLEEFLNWHQEIRDSYA